VKTFVEIFQSRGSAYDRAMRRFPQARDMEFAQVVQAARLQPGSVVGDVPAGGNYLQRYLPRSCHWVGHEPCSTFNPHATTHRGQPTPLLPVPWADSSVDAAISLAGVHHLEEKRPFFVELYRAVKPGGRLVVADVLEDSAVARFLDGFVGANNSTGHQGAYLNVHTAHALRETGWTVEAEELKHFHWRFSTLGDMAAFCHELFDLRRCSVADTQAAIEKRLGVTRWPDGTVGMAWSLLTISALKQRAPKRSGAH
jgi:SAM-dependent methyltransferase